ncbi:hypothetical protein OIU34_19605 [Pararhizobium sp. BT-229]|uniref:hypothetical protein n=1 Tax=Pararhizobium sp. BT-229 TaxID=2986923 RepID=UPI0021F732C5|nr:hypothetical protein [Pararhizobium sp. BT-229]MCV9964091.1 hypothetical protein [Pararhizobium sp. BT-229]
MAFFDDWTSGRGGGLEYRDDNVRLLARPCPDGWMLFVTDDEGEVPYHPAFRWNAETLEMLEGMAAFVIDYASKKAELAARPDIRKETELEDGWKIVARRERGTSFIVTLHTETGEHVGEYAGFLNTPLPTFVLGETTIQGSQTLSDVARGKGLADRMRDAAEDVTGLRAVPHGRNFTQGSLSEAAAKSWARRASAKRVPGITPELAVNVRRELAKTVEERFRELTYADSLAGSIEISAGTGCDIVVGYVDGEPKFAWAVSSDGVPVSPTGIVDGEYLAETLVAQWTNPGFGVVECEVVLARLDAEEAKTLLSEEELGYRRDKETLSFAARMVEKMRKGMLRKAGIDAEVATWTGPAVAKLG